MGEFSPDYIVGIYTLQNNEPVPVIRYGGGRTAIYILNGICGNHIINEAWGHMGNGWEAYYIIDADGSLLMIDEFHTTDFDLSLYKQGIFTERRTRVINGIEIEITENEYVALANNYGSMGYEPYWYKSNWRELEATMPLPLEFEWDSVFNFR
jgi:hypothetical protein